MSTTTLSTLTADGVEIFYRSSGPVSGPPVILLHGFPSSSHMFRNFIPLLSAQGHHVIAPDLPGFGFTTVPPSREYTYTFSSLATTFAAFVTSLNLTRPFALYIFDYGAPVGLRYALSHPDSVAAIITQNGNAYVDGLSPTFWAPLKKLWASGSTEDREALRPVVELDFTKWQYLTGAPNPDQIPPEAYYLDQALLDRPGNKEIQLDLFADYGTNVELYDKFHEYFRTSGVPVLTAWGKNDECFIPPGAEAYARDVKKLETRWLNTGHFALETNESQMAEWIVEFFEKFEVFKKTE